ncbi:hypothetical protein DM01DRAFT_1338766 [Hesseltinella vesiculosa]|uniref:Kinetochore protein SPC25 n=1 Tax=Hesseltinella vesiculosa TaxID=101127 RepID=A0A1X2GAE9_9FUNG|nr:hypothetical protein DM01DRAFT_1338766 [Hesseltinella vesiculosa]
MSSTEWHPPALNYDLETIQKQLSSKKHDLDSFIQQVQEQHATTTQKSLMEIEEMQAKNNELKALIEERKASIAHYESLLPQAVERLEQLRKDEKEQQDRKEQLERECDAIATKNDTFALTIAAKERELEEKRALLDTQQKRNRPELEACMKYTGLALEPLKNNQLKLTFTLIDPKELDRAFTLVLDMSNDKYAVPKCEPQIPNLAQMVQDLNQHGNPSLFTIQARQAFSRLVL